ncbi:glycosyltransferase family 4 protein [Candidatus Parcubacteria bacterium]|nr:glycosyltransferase family 4 protein [Candidatus Parcubacteria bacterium]
MAKKLKVGLISFHSFFQPGGVKKHILGLRKEFKKIGVDTKIIAPRRKKTENYGKDVILLGTSFAMPFSGSQADFCINFNPISLKRTLEKEKFDVLHFHNFGFPSALQVLQMSDALNILTFHANIKGSKFLKNFPEIIYLFQKIAQWKIDGVIGVAQLNLEYFKNFKKPKAIIPNGIDLEEFNPNAPKIEKFNDGKINILFVGRIEERKGLIYLLKAYKILQKKFSNLRLIIIGDGDLKKDCELYVKEQKLKQVFFEGQISGKKLVSYFTTCDIFVSPAIFGESFGIVLLEAMACAKPIVCFSNLGYKQLLQRTKGEKFLVKPRDYNGLANKIAILVKDKKLRKEMGKWGRKEAENYSWNKIAKKILDFYQLCKQSKQKFS